jgi:3',5'-cyclic AMP phosphodiesterase CpdA
MRIAVTADLHFGPRHSAGRDATLALAAELHHDPPDLFLLAGDIGVEDEFARCLELFEALPCPKALVPGNHDVWVRSDDPRGDSLALYREYLPRVAADHAFHYLDAAPLLLPGLAVVGSMNWYDYSWAVERLRETTPDWEERLRTKRFTRGRHNDANFVRWDTDDVAFTRDVVGTLAEHLQVAEAHADVLAVTHHPPFRALNYPKDEPIDADGLLWEAFSGNAACEALLANAGRVRFAFCGHTHFARDGELGAIRGYNVGGDYHFKRLLRLDWPAGTVTATTFGEE